MELGHRVCLCKTDAWTSLPPSGMTTNKTFFVKNVMCVCYILQKANFYLEISIRDKNHSTSNQPQHTGSFLTLEGEGPHSVVAGPVVCGSRLVQIPRRGQNHSEPCFSHPAHFTQVTALSPYLHHRQRGTLQHNAVDYQTYMNWLCDLPL